MQKVGSNWKDNWHFFTYSLQALLLAQMRKISFIERIKGVVIYPKHNFDIEA